MNIKNYAQLIVAFVVICGNMQAKLGYMDTLGGVNKLSLAGGFVGLKTGSLLKENEKTGALKTALLEGGFILWQANKLNTNTPVNLLGKKTDALETDSHADRCMKHMIWYGIPIANKSLSPFVENAVFYPVVDKLVDKAAGELNKNEYIQKIGETIPKQHHAFIVENGKLICASAMTRWISDHSIEIGRKRTNFYKAATMQVGCQATEEYIIMPLVEKIAGKEESFTKDALSIGLNLAAYIAIHSALSS